MFNHPTKSAAEVNEHNIKCLEHRIAHHSKYRRQLVEEALQLSSSNPRKEFLLRRAEQFAKNIGNLENALYELYAQRTQQS